MIGFEVGYSNLRAVKLDNEHQIVGFNQAVWDTRQSLVAQVVDFINRTKEIFGDFERVGVAVSGIVDKTRNKILLSRHFAELSSTDLAAELKQNCKVDAVLENDANAGAWAEYKLGAGIGTESVFYILLSRGVGGAIICGDKLWPGSAGFAGEIGHVLVNTEENLRVEDVASSDGILRRIRNRIHQDQTSSLARISEELITITDVVREANNGDDFTQMMLERTGNYLGIAVAGLINILNIERIIVGGDIMQAGTPILRGISQTAAQFAFRPSFDSTQIISGSLGDKSVAIGAALLAQ